MEQREYVRQVLEAYRATPGTAGAVRRPDRLLAAQLHARRVPVEAVENALILAAARRLARPADAPPLGVIRSLAYFSPVIEEVLQLKVSQEYFQHLRHKLSRLSARMISSPLTLRATTAHAYGAHDASCSGRNPVPCLGHFNRALLGHFS